MTAQTLPTSPSARRIETAIRAVLPAKVDVRVLKTNASTVELKVAGQKIRAQWIGAGMPGDVRSIWAAKGSHPDVLVARQISPGLRDELSHRGIGWIDELGAAELSIGNVIVSRSGRPPPAVKKPSRWTPAVMSVAEALLCDTRATVESIQHVTGLSVGSSTNALRLLTELGFLEASSARGRASARRIDEFDKLLEAYSSAATAFKRPTSLVVGVTWRDPLVGLAELGQKWTKMKLDWAATGGIAAAVLAPLLTTVASSVVYVDASTVAELEAIAARVGLRPIDGGRLTLTPFPTSTTQRLAATRDGLRIAPWPRVYADLRGVGVRGEEAAAHLKEAVRGG